MSKHRLLKNTNWILKTQTGDRKGEQSKGRVHFNKQPSDVFWELVSEKMSFGPGGFLSVWLMTFGRHLSSRVRNPFSIWFLKQMPKP